jgi:hypothetical protein
MSSRLIVRQAGLSDVDSITDIALAAMPMDPQWNWRFPLRQEFPMDNYTFTRIKYLEFLENKNGHWRAMIAECQPSGQQKAIAIAFAVWDVRNIKKLHIRLMPHLPQGMSMDLPDNIFGNRLTFQIRSAST